LCDDGLSVGHTDKRSAGPVGQSVRVSRSVGRAERRTGRTDRRARSRNGRTRRTGLQSKPGTGPIFIQVLNQGSANFQIRDHLTGIGLKNFLANS